MSHGITYNVYRYDYYLKYLALKAGQLRHVSRPGGTLTEAVKQPYGACCLTGLAQLLLLFLLLLLLLCITFSMHVIHIYYFT